MSTTTRSRSRSARTHALDRATPTALNRLRVRWAAIGAAIAVTLGAGTIATVDAIQTSGERSTYVATEPCRLIDTRPEPEYNVGDRTSPLGPGGTLTVEARGAHGNCTAAQLPDDATALALNVTVPFASSNGFLTIWGAGPRPDASSLNPAPAQPPGTNAVTTTLSDTGTFRVYNEHGATHVIIDVVGHHRDHNHDDRYYTEDEVNARIAALEAAQPFAVTNRDASETVGSADEVVVFVEVRAPVAGQVTLNSSTTASESTGGDQVACSITTADTHDADYVHLWESGGAGDGFAGHLAGTRTYDIAPGDTVRYNLVCSHFGVSPGATVANSTLTAIFTPALPPA